MDDRVRRHGSGHHRAAARWTSRGSRHGRPAVSHWRQVTARWPATILDDGGGHRSGDWRTAPSAPNEQASRRHDRRTFGLRLPECLGHAADLGQRDPDAPMLTRGRHHPHLGRDLRPGQTGQPAPWPMPGSTAGDRVAFLDRNGIEYFEVFFGCALLGAVQRGHELALGPRRDGRHHRGRPLPGGLLRTRLCRGRERDRPRWSTCVSEWVPLDRLRPVAGRRRARIRPRPRIRARPRRGGHPALHLGDHRPAQGGHDLGAEHLVHPDRGRSRSSVSEPTRSRWSPCRSSTSAGRGGRCAACHGVATR